MKREPGRLHDETVRFGPVGGDGDVGERERAGRGERAGGPETEAAADDHQRGNHEGSPARIRGEDEHAERDDTNVDHEHRSIDQIESRESTLAMQEPIYGGGVDQDESA